MGALQSGQTNIPAAQLRVTWAESSKRPRSLPSEKARGDLISVMPVGHSRGAALVIAAQVPTLYTVSPAGEAFKAL